MAKEDFKKKVGNSRCHSLRRNVEPGSALEQSRSRAGRDFEENLITLGPCQAFIHGQKGQIISVGRSTTSRRWKTTKTHDCVLGDVCIEQ